MQFGDFCDCFATFSEIYDIHLSTLVSNPHVQLSELPLQTFPWGVALLRARDGRVLQSNSHMQRHYLHTESGNQEILIEEAFTFADRAEWHTLLESIEDGNTWSVRAVPLKSRHGVTSVELMIHRDASDPERIWLYTLEHPEVGGHIRFSSRVVGYYRSCWIIHSRIRLFQGFAKFYLNEQSIP